MYTHLYTNTVKYIYIYEHSLRTVHVLWCLQFEDSVKAARKRTGKCGSVEKPCWHGVKYRRMWDLCARASRKRRGKMQSIECFELLVFQWDIFALTPSPSTHIRLASIFLALLQSELARGLLVNFVTHDRGDTWPSTHLFVAHWSFLTSFCSLKLSNKENREEVFVWQDSVVDAVNRYWGRIDVKCRKSPTASYHEFHCGTNCRWTTGEHHPLAQGLCTAASEGTWHSCSPSMVRLDLRYLWCIFQHPRGSEMLVETVFRIWVKSRHDSAPPKCFESKEPDNWNSVAISDISATYFRIFKHPHFCKHFRFGMCTQVKIKEHKWWEFGCIHWRGTDLRRCWGRQEPKNVKLDCGPSWRHYRKAKRWNRLGKLHFQPSVEEAKIPKKSSIWTPKTDYPIC